MAALLQISDVMGKSLNELRNIYLRKKVVSDRARLEMKRIEQLAFEFSGNSKLSPSFFEGDEVEDSWMTM
jgi:hypothetical protein